MLGIFDVSSRVTVIIYTENMAQHYNYEHFEKYDMNTCFILSNEDVDQAAELYLNRYVREMHNNTNIFSLYYLLDFYIDIPIGDSLISAYFVK